MRHDVDRHIILFYFLLSLDLGYELVQPIPTKYMLYISRLQNQRVWELSPRSSSSFDEYMINAGISCTIIRL